MNPITSARVEAGFSKHELEKRTGISRTCILRAEDACYEQAPNKLKEFSVKTLQISNREFVRRYQHFQETHRKESAFDKIPLQVINLMRLDAIWDPDMYVTVKLNSIFKEWREDYYRSIVVFCRAFCVHPASVENYEKGLYKSMPTALAEALNSVNLIHDSFNPDLEEVWVRK